MLLDQATKNLKVINQRNPKLRDGMIFRLIAKNDYESLIPDSQYIYFLYTLINQYGIKYDGKIRYDERGQLVDFDYFYRELYCRFSDRFERQWVVFYPEEGQQDLFEYKQLPWALKDEKGKFTNLLKQELNLDKINNAFFILERLLPQEIITNPLLLQLDDSIQASLIEIDYWIKKLNSFNSDIHITQDGQVANLDYALQYLEKEFVKRIPSITFNENKLTDVICDDKLNKQRSRYPQVSDFTFNDTLNVQQTSQLKNSKYSKFEQLLSKVDIGQDIQSQNKFRTKNLKQGGLILSQIKLYNNQQKGQINQKQPEIKNKENLQNVRYQKSIGQNEKIHVQNQKENVVNQQLSTQNQILIQSTISRAQIK